MKGLEGILVQIEEDARRQAEELLSAARQEARQALEAAREKAGRQSDQILKAAQEEADAIRERAESAARMEKRDQVLRCKQRLIREAVGEVCRSLEEAPPEEYFAVLLELAGRFALPGSGEMYLNARDLERLPRDFEAALERIAPGGAITVSKTPREIDSGFVLAYGPVEMDCTFPGLFQDAYDQLRDAVGAILFSPA